MTPVLRLPAPPDGIEPQPGAQIKPLSPPQTEPVCIGDTRTGVLGTLCLGDTRATQKAGGVGDIAVMA